jgi:hypothetical protein
MPHTFLAISRRCSAPTRLTDANDDKSLVCAARFWNPTFWPSAQKGTQWIGAPHRDNGIRIGPIATRWRRAAKVDEGETGRSYHPGDVVERLASIDVFFPANIVPC